MGESIRTTKTLLIVYYLITIHVAVVYFLVDKIATRYTVVPVEPTVENAAGQHVSEATAVPTPSSTVAAAPITPTVQPTQIIPQPNAAGLIIPVAGVRRDQLTDSFADSRSEGRVHDAIDIAAPAGTPVVAAADGTILKFWDSQAGGITIYQSSSDKRFVYYYAHLQRRADDIKEGDEIKQGRTIGFVGDTGNAGAGNYHLHFSISAVTDPKRYWEGVNINPFPLLTQ
jgi:peptidoglycan LD-endopeptidase LytH